MYAFVLIHTSSTSVAGKPIDPRSKFNYARGWENKDLTEIEEFKAQLFGRKVLNRQFVQLVFSDVSDVSHVLIEETHSSMRTTREKLDLMRIVSAYPHHAMFYPVLYRAIWQREKSASERALLVEEVVKLMDSDKTTPSYAWAVTVGDLKSPQATQAFKRMVLRKPIVSITHWPLFVKVITEQDPGSKESLKRHAERHAELLMMPFKDEAP